jgi:hypothetical protein
VVPYVPVVGSSNVITIVADTSLSNVLVVKIVGTTTESQLLACCTLQSWLSSNVFGVTQEKPGAVPFRSFTKLLMTVVVTDVPQVVAPPLEPEGTTDEHLVELFTMLPK